MRILVWFLLTLAVLADDEKNNKNKDKNKDKDKDKDKTNNKKTDSPMPTFTAFPSAPPSITPQPTFPPTSPPPTREPTGAPTGMPVTPVPTIEPSEAPTPQPTVEPTASPIVSPTASPTMPPTSNPTMSPMPSISPAPTNTVAPSNAPTQTVQPSNAPTVPNTAVPLPNYGFIMLKAGPPVNGVAESIELFMETYLGQQYDDFVFVSADKETTMITMNTVTVDFTKTMAHFVVQEDDNSMVNMTVTTNATTTATNSTQEGQRRLQESGIPDPFDLATALNTRFTFFGSERLMEHLQMDGFNITAIQSITSNGELIGGDDVANMDRASPDDSDDSPLNAYAISGIAIGASVLVIGGAIFALRRRQSDLDISKDDSSSKPPPPAPPTNDDLAIKPTASASDSVSAAGAVMEPRKLDSDDDDEENPKYPQPYTRYAKADDDDEAESVNYSTDGDIVSVTESLHAQDGPLFNVKAAVSQGTETADEIATTSVDPKSGKGSVRPTETEPTKE